MEKDDIVKVEELLKYGRQYLKQNNIEDYDLILKILIEYVFKINKNKIIIYKDNELDEEKCEEYKYMIKKIADGTPLQYIVNHQEFMSLNFYVDENVLIPQPDTELIVEEVINEYSNKKCKILDLCTGSGAIGISLAKYINNAEVFATDISKKAIQISKLNAEKNFVWKRMTFIESDMFENLKEKNFDAIVSNPPYIETNVIEKLSNQVQSEPYIALDGGEDGLKFYRIIVDEAYKYLKNDGKIFLEIGYNQKDTVGELISKSGKYCDMYSKKDLGGNDRLIVATVRR
ncbi:MAG: peptide chain release factor N(5)-glutamine methyltransferase [Clostridia bacterium]|nr:peptide chain release factor N(5)-glutamine methyltransferase [Clostridia bacterium]